MHKTFLIIDKLAIYFKTLFINWNSEPAVVGSCVNKFSLIECFFWVNQKSDWKMVITSIDKEATIRNVHIPTFHLKIMKYLTNQISKSH